MQVCAVFHQQCQVYVVHALCQLSCPVVFGKNGADNLQPVVCFRQRSAAAVQKKAPPEAEHQQKSQFSFHILSLPSVGIAAFEIENDFHIRIITQERGFVKGIFREICRNLLETLDETREM